MIAGRSRATASARRAAEITSAAARKSNWSPTPGLDGLEGSWAATVSPIGLVFRSQPGNLEIRFTTNEAGITTTQMAQTTYVASRTSGVFLPQTEIVKAREQPSTVVPTITRNEPVRATGSIPPS